MTGMEALLYYVLLMIAVVLVYAGQRIPLALTGKRPIDSWTRGKPVIDPGFIVRATHAHANMVENLPLFAAVVLAAAAMGQSPVVDAYACYVLYARIAQLVMHLIGTSF
ncbi:MAG: MAPEG family protein, partial [Panacagrimonas sp.]